MIDKEGTLGGGGNTVERSQFFILFAMIESDDIHGVWGTTM